jgi:hypothetical protein
VRKENRRQSMPITLIWDFRVDVIGIAVAVVA